MWKCNKCNKVSAIGVCDCQANDEEIQLNVKIKKKYKKWLDRRAFEDEKDIKTIVDRLLEDAKDLGRRFDDVEKR